MSDKICPLPWIHLHLHPNGRSSVCCESDHVLNTGYAYDNKEYGEKEFKVLGKHLVREIVDSENYNGIRKAMIEGKEHSACKGCYDAERAGAVSKRQRELQKWGDQSWNVHKNTRYRQQGAGQIKFLEVRPGNTCNLKCTTCNPYSSTKWLKDHAVLESKFSFVEHYNEQWNPWLPKNAGRYYAWDQLRTIDPTFMEEIYFNGGEPMLLYDHWSYLQVIKPFASNIRLRYSTNLTSVAESGIKLWRNFKSIELSLSMDDIDKRGEYLRYPIKFKDWVSQLDRIRGLDLPDLKLSICQTVSSLNVHYLNELWDFAKTENLGVYLNWVVNPPYLSLDLYTREEIDRIMEPYLKSPPSHVSNLKGYLQFTSNGQGLGTKEKMRSFLDELDILRHTDWRATFPKATYYV